MNTISLFCDLLDQQNQLFLIGHCIYQYFLKTMDTKLIISYKQVKKMPLLSVRNLFQQLLFQTMLSLTQTHLLDMTGFLDNLNYVAVMRVPYFIKSVFEKMKRAKFIIVTSYHFFQEDKGTIIINTFQGLFQLFHIDKIKPEIKNQLFCSISFLITRVENKNSSYKCYEIMLKE